MTTNSIARFQSVWDWYQVAAHAFDVFEEDIQLNPDKHLAMLGFDAVQSINLNLQSSRDELENFACQDPPDHLPQIKTTPAFSPAMF